MYSEEYLHSYPFFSEALKTVRLEALHDSLTGLLSRPAILALIRDLIRLKTPFRLGILDLDNFKNINDHYGHHSGDRVLSQLGADLREYVGDAGLVGRFGGDEFLIVTLRDIDYSEAHRFYKELFDGERVLRRTLRFEGESHFITATVGSAAFPADADSYEAVFALADKTLYRGKTKGRNCFILYVPSKHESLRFPSVGDHGLYGTFRAMAEGFDSGEDAFDRLARGFAPMCESLSLTQLFYLDSAGSLTDVLNARPLGKPGMPRAIADHHVFALSDPKEFDAQPDALFTLLRGEAIESVLMIRAGKPEEGFGCLLLCPEAHTRHVWIDRDYAAAFFLSRMLAQHLRLKAQLPGSA